MNTITGIWMMKKGEILAGDNIGDLIDVALSPQIALAYITKLWPSIQYVGKGANDFDTYLVPEVDILYGISEFRVINQESVEKLS